MTGIGCRAGLLEIRAGASSAETLPAEIELISNHRPVALDDVSSGEFILLVYEGKAFQPIVERFGPPAIEPTDVV